MMLGSKFHRVTLATITLTCMSGTPMVRAQDASAWEMVSHGAARLIAGATHNSGDGVWRRAGVEIRLDPGWHTYWRYPGDSGVPPTFDFSGSENIKSATVLWPAPKLFASGAGGYSIGYFDHVVFPLRITALDTAKPSLLHLKLGYAMCANLCLPVETNLELTVSGKDGAEEPTLVAAEAHVPRHAPLGATSGLAVRSVHRERGDGHERVVVEVAAPDNMPVDLFVEGPTPNWALPLPEQTIPVLGGASGERWFTFDLEGLPPGVHGDGATLTFTIIALDEAVEVAAPLH